MRLIRHFNRLKTFQGDPIWKVIKCEHVKLSMQAMLTQGRCVYDGGVAPPRCSREATNSLRIFSLNTWLSFFVGGPDRTKRINRMLEFIFSRKRQFDVLIFQELFSIGLGPCGVLKAESEAVKRALHGAGFVHTIDDDSIPYIGQNSGLFIASRLPIKNAKFRSFSLRRKLSAKGLLMCEIDSIGIATTHLEHKAEDIQRSQVETIARAVQETRSQVDTVLIGDFNMCPTRSPESYTFLESKLLGATNKAVEIPWTCDLRMAKDPARTLSYLTDHVPIDEPKDWGATLDHCWVLPRIVPSNSSDDTCRRQDTRSIFGHEKSDCLRVRCKTAASWVDSATSPSRMSLVSDHLPLDIEIERG